MANTKMLKGWPPMTFDMGCYNAKIMDLWICLAISDYFCFFLAISGYFWLFLAVSGYFWLILAKSG